VRKYFIIFLLFVITTAAFALDDIFPAGFGIRASGMGGAFTAIADDVSAIYYNPAGLPLSSMQFIREQMDWEKKYSKASDLTSFTLGDLGYANCLQSDKDSLINRIQFYSWGTRGTRGFYWGVSYKDFHNNDNNGKALDVGLLFNITEYLSLGLTGQNIALQDLEYNSLFRLGLAYEFIYDNVTLAMDLLSSNDDAQISYGLEYTPINGLALRTGFAPNKFSFGFSLFVFGGNINYAMSVDPNIENAEVCRLGFETINIGNKKRKSTLIPSEKCLEINIQGNLTSGQDNFSIIGGFNQGIDNLLDYLRRANKDDEIKSIVLRLNNFPEHIFASALVQEVREELKKAKEKKKKIVVYVDELALGNTYYLASIADKIVMPGTGVVGGIGKNIQIHRMYKLFKNLGIEWQIIQKGKYKTAFNNLKDKNSPQEEEMILTLLKDVYEQMLKDISESREIDLDELRLLADGQLLTAEEAKEKKLIDEIGYYEKAKDLANNSSGNNDKFLSVRDLYPEEIKESLFMPWNRIAVVNINGPIILGENYNDIIWGGYYTGAETIVEQFEQIKKDNSIRAVIIRINSPGGSATASDRIYKAIKELQEEDKVVVASMGNMAASGGYYIAAACDKIVANPSTFTGSIGVISVYPVLKELYEKIGIEVEQHKEGKYTDIFSGVEKLDEESKMMLQNILDKIYKKFIIAVSEGRDLSEDEVKKLAEGRIYTGTEALANGLVDYLGNFTTAIDKAKTLANIKREASLVYYREDSPQWLQDMGHNAMNFLGIKDGIFPMKSKLKESVLEMKIY